MSQTTRNGTYQRRFFASRRPRERDQDEQHAGVVEPEPDRLQGGADEETGAREGFARLTRPSRPESEEAARLLAACKNLGRAITPAMTPATPTAIASGRSAPRSRLRERLGPHPDEGDDRQVDRGVRVDARQHAGDKTDERCGRDLAPDEVVQEQQQRRADRHPERGCAARQQMQENGVPEVQTDADPVARRLSGRLARVAPRDVAQPRADPAGFEMSPGTASHPRLPSRKNSATAMIAARADVVRRWTISARPSSSPVCR